MNLRKSGVFLLVAVLIFLMVAGIGQTKESVVKIGFLGALTGDVAMYGQPTLLGMKMAAEKINKSGGVNQAKIVIVEADNRGDKQEAASIVQKFISRDKVAAIVGDPTTGITKVAAPICERNRVVLLSAGATGTGVVELGKYIFRDTLLDTVAVPALVDYFTKNLGYKKVAVITSDNNDYSVGLTQVFKNAVKGKSLEIITEEKVKDGDKDFSAQITNIKAKNPDIIFFSGYYTEGALIMKEARKQGLKICLFGGDGLYSPTLISLGGAAIEGSMVYVGFSPEQPTPETAKFIQEFKAQNKGQVPGLFETQGYDAVMILAEAMKRAKSNVPTKFRNEVARTKNFKGVSGTITFQANQEPVKSPVYLLEVKNGQYALKAKVPVSIK
ncbi:amino acid/amide ABC transporter substrate-binding protein (HAAT family) [Hydrogenispora ethanolica]|jgi:branched-chain amino acid transport system substrate-binding protein|uniref:Amino acid/amide ABC transporter substrate-binding protein (HAAT family) n=1 Tax=Hydrogenispora ethanolica TaxID=1082276 RepID=A0A4R1RC01_HYDET|nr:ABC transporter substrate-binding protein [Hydrogenispora ethanolica]TCL62982.1 amino acid/amide ABC transporter substrate-binding protein (HAAT family) [Hydrogenispora ethanolica]